MSGFKRFFESIRRVPADASFESYYGTLVRSKQVGSPTASEARRDFQAIRSHLDRSLIF